MKQYQPNTPFDIPFKVLTLTKAFINGIKTIKNQKILISVV